MKKYQSVILFISIFLVSFFVWKGYFSPQKLLVSPSSQPVSSVLKSPETEVFSIPVHLAVPKLDISANSESVGMDDQGRMDVPKNVLNVAWYNLGVKPGQEGNAVFAGHYDKPDGSPSVFYNLNKLQAGDTIELLDENQKKLIFKVMEKRVVKLNEFPLQEVFGETDKTRVNLITCGGKWDKEKKEYSERTIIFSELKNS